MPKDEPTRLGDLVRAKLPSLTHDPQPVDKSVDSARTAGLAGVGNPSPRNDHTPPVGNSEWNTGTVPAFQGEAATEAAEGVGGHDPDGLDVAFQVVSHLGGILPPPSVRPPRRRRTTDAPRRDTGDLEPVGGVLDSFIDERGWTTQVALRVLLDSWPALVGADNAAHSRPETFADGVLTVRAESTSWASALRFVAPQVVAKLNERLGDGAVTRIAVLGPAAPSWKHGPRSVHDARGPRDTYG